MAHLWVKDEADQWSVLPLEQPAFTLTSNGPRSIDDLSQARRPAQGVLLMRTGDADGKWVLIASIGTEVTINGLPIIAGIRLLADKDEIRVSSGDSYYFSTESLARVEQFPGAETTLFCPRCKQEISPGLATVRCPACGVWHHETDQLNCWTYSDACAMCGHTTEMHGTFSWTPEEL